MTAALRERVPVEEITAQAREVRFGPTVLLWIAAVFYAVGWFSGKTLGVVWLALVWSWTAARVGWQEARTPATVAVPERDELAFSAARRAQTIP